MITKEQGRGKEMIKDIEEKKFTPKQAATLAMRRNFCMNWEDQIFELLENATPRDLALIQDQYKKLEARLWKKLESIRMPEGY